MCRDQQRSHSLLGRQPGGVLGNSGISTSAVPVPVRSISNPPVECEQEKHFTPARAWAIAAPAAGAGQRWRPHAERFDNSTVPVTVWGFRRSRASAADRRRRAAHRPAAGRATPSAPAATDWGRQASLASQSTVECAHPPTLMKSRSDTIALRPRGQHEVSCWGRNAVVSSAMAKRRDVEQYAGAVWYQHRDRALSAGRSHTCALLAPGGVLSLGSDRRTGATTRRATG